MLRKNSKLTIATDPATSAIAALRFNFLHPPFDNPKVRQAVRAAIKQEDYMRAAVGDDTSLWRTCRSAFPCGTPYQSEALGQRLMEGNLDNARRLLAASGYAGQRVVIINPTDFPLIGPLGQVTADLLKQMGMNVDLQESDWGTVVQRRASREPVEKGGWSIFHTTGSSSGWVNPAVAQQLRGQGAKGWFGWWDNPKQEELVRDWLAAPDEAAQTRVAMAIGELAMEEVPSIPLGQYYICTVFRKNLVGMLQGPCPLPWNLRRV